MATAVGLDAPLVRRPRDRGEPTHGLAPVEMLEFTVAIGLLVLSGWRLSSSARVRPWLTRLARSGRFPGLLFGAFCLIRALATGRGRGEWQVPGRCGWGACTSKSHPLSEYFPDPGFGLSVVTAFTAAAILRGRSGAERGDLVPS